MNRFMGDLLSAFSALSASAIAFAGSGPAFIDCESASGRTHVEIEIQDITGPLEEINFSIDNQVLTFEEGTNVSVFNRLDDQVFTFSAYNRNSGVPMDYFKLWAIPGTVEKPEEMSHYEQYATFEAKVSATDPREGRQFSPVITVSCVLAYDI